MNKEAEERLLKEASRQKDQVSCEKEFYTQDTFRCLTAKDRDLITWTHIATATLVGSRCQDGGENLAKTLTKL